MADKFVVKFTQAGDFREGDVITEEQVGDSKDKWLAEGAIVKADSGAELQVAGAADSAARLPENTTGDMKFHEGQNNEGDGTNDTAADGKNKGGK